MKCLSSFEKKPLKDTPQKMKFSIFHEETLNGKFLCLCSGCFLNRNIKKFLNSLDITKSLSRLIINDFSVCNFFKIDQDVCNTYRFLFLIRKFQL